MEPQSPAQVQNFREGGSEDNICMHHNPTHCFQGNRSLGRVYSPGLTPLYTALLSFEPLFPFHLNFTLLQKACHDSAFPICWADSWFLWSAASSNAMDWWSFVRPQMVSLGLIGLRELILNFCYSRLFCLLFTFSNKHRNHNLPAKGIPEQNLKPATLLYKPPGYFLSAHCCDDCLLMGVVLFCFS